jgi:hypothetical protein
MLAPLAVKFTSTSPAASPAMEGLKTPTPAPIAAPVI